MPFRAEVLHPYIDTIQTQDGLADTVVEFRARRFRHEAMQYVQTVFQQYHEMLVERNGNRNAVDLKAVQEGRDVRTTVGTVKLDSLLSDLTESQIMLRNIPNRIDHVSTMTDSG